MASAKRTLRGAGAGYQGCYVDFRRDYVPFEGGRLTACHYSAELSPGLERAVRRIVYQFALDADGPIDYGFLIPAEKEQVHDVHCAQGNRELKFELQSSPGDRIILKVAGDQLEFSDGVASFSVWYAAPVFSISAVASGTKTTAYSDFIMHSAPCDRLTVEVQTPPDVHVIRTMPPFAATTGNTFRYRADELRSGEYFSFVLGLTSAA